MSAPPAADGAASRPMTAEERGALERRLALESANGRVLIGAHLVLIGLASGLVFLGDDGRKAALFVAILLGLSGSGWLVVLAVLFGRLRADLRGGEVREAEVALTGKRAVAARGGTHYHFTLEPPLPQRDARVNAPVYEAHAEGERLKLSWFPRSKVLARVERAA